MAAPPDPHAARSDLERALCLELRRQDLPHAHRSLHFRVRLRTGEARFDPSLVVHRGEVLFLIEPLTGSEATEGDPEILTRFLEQHSEEIVLIVVAPRAVTDSLPPDSYDEVYAEDEIQRVVRRIRDQDPHGIVEPFPKTHPP